MTDCCTEESESKRNLNKQNCPACQNQCNAVKQETVLHHITSPWIHTLTDQPYYFCDDSHCDIVYFCNEQSIIRKSQTRQPVGIKETSDSALICYCFGVTRSEAHNNESAKVFVIEQTKNGTCSCSTHNPSGKCCLKDFSR